MAEENPRRWPHFLGLLRPRLEQLRAPEGPFDPNSAWEHRYTVLVVGNFLRKPTAHYPYGKLRLKRRPAGDGQIALDLDLDATAVTGTGLCTSASITCADDRLATPRRWELRAHVKNKGQTVAETALHETGEVRGDVIVRRGETERTIPAAPRFTSKWMHEYFVKPYWYAMTPDAPLYPVLKNEIDYCLDFDIRTQEPDGSAKLTFWVDGIDRRVWKSIWTLESLEVLKAYNRIEGA